MTAVEGEKRGDITREEDVEERMDNKNTTNTMIKLTKGNVSFINKQLVLFSYNRLFYRVEKIERLGVKSCLADRERRGSYGRFIAAFRGCLIVFFMVSHLEGGMTWNALGSPDG